MTTGRSTRLCPSAATCGLRRMLMLGVLALFAWCLTAGSVFAQVANPIKTQGQLRVIGLRVQFDPDKPPTADTGQQQLPQLPETLFKAANDAAYFRDVMTNVSDYFKEVSLGKLNLATTLGPVVTITDYDKDAAYYGNDANQTSRSVELIQRAITMSENVVDFTQYDLVIVFHAGMGQESDFTDANPNLILSNGYFSTFTGDGKSFPAAVIQSAAELAPATGESLSIVGRLCYGIAKVIGQGAMSTGSGMGLPNDNSYVGSWDLMDRGWMLGATLTKSNRTDWSKPAHMNPYEKARMGWLTPVNLTNNMPGAKIEQVETSGTVYRLAKGGLTGSEYFLVENRQKYGFDTYLPSSGLLIWHIDETQANQGNPQRLRIALLQADGRSDIENQQNYGDVSDPLPGQLSVRTIDDTTTPSTHDATGNDTGISITEISNSSQSMTANLYVVPPMILSFKPAAGFITESVTPTFTATLSSEIEPNTIKLLIDNQVVVDKNNLTTNYDRSTRTLTYRSAQLAYGQHTVQLSVQNSTKTVTESTGDRVFRVNFRTVSSGLHMVSVPYKLISPDNNPASVFGVSNVQLARWDPATKKYLYYPGDEYAGFNPPANTMDPTRSVSAAPAGLGYWINLTTDSPVRINGDQLETEPYRIPLQTGWNMIGNPFTFAVDWNGIQVEYQGQTKTLAEAIDEEWIKDALYKYQSSGYTWQTAPYGNMQPWEGYWVKANYPVTLIVPPIESGIGSLEDAARSRAANTKNSASDWRIRLSVRSASGAADVNNVIGISRNARDGNDKADVEKPPLPFDGAVCLNLREGGRCLAQDLRGPEVGTGKSWQFDVVSDLKQEQITVQWPDMSKLPSTLEACLEDLYTGRKIYTRTSGGYTYNSGQGGTRSFKLTVLPRRTSTLMISDLSVLRTRGVPSVHFNLSREAVVTVSLVDPTGKIQRQLAVERTATAGVNTISTGRADGLAPGLYLVQVTATASDGVSVRATRPLVIVR